MSELCAFARSKSSVKVLPLFLHLSPDDLKEDQNLELWRKVWSSFAQSDPQRINVKEWEDALALLQPQNGLVRTDVKAEGELAFIERILISILSSPDLVTPRNRYDTSYVQGEARLCQIILDKFHEMESSCHHQQHADQSSNGFSLVLGMHGIPGSGKSTLCSSLAKYFFRVYAGRSLHVELPTNPTMPTLLHALKGFLSLRNPLHIGTESMTHIDQLVSVIKNHGSSSWNATFVAVDNISEESVLEVSKILPHVIGLVGSKVILTARNCDVLCAIMRILSSHMSSLARNCTLDFIAMPSINETEAMDILLQSTGQGRTDARATGEAGESWCGETQLIDNYNMDAAQKQKVLQVVRMCGFGPKDGPLMYLPVVMQRMGVALIIRQNNVHEWVHDQEVFWSSFNVQDVRSSKEHVVAQLILNSFETILDEELQLLFMDVALFTENFQDSVPSHQACTSVLEKAYSILGAMHGKLDAAEVKTKVRDLQGLCFIQRATSDDGFVIHDLYREFANSFYERRFKHGAYGVYCFTGEQKIYLDEKMVNQDKAGRPLRGMVLRVGGKCEELVLKNFPDLKALVVTNCFNLGKFRMEGFGRKLSLASLDVIGFGRKLPVMQICSNVSVPNVVRRLNLACLAVSCKMDNTTDLDWTRLLFFRESTEAGCSAWPDIGIAMHMRCLQSLILRGTGIEKLEDMGSFWPHLKELHVHECLLTTFRLGTLPALTTLVFKDCIDLFYHMTSQDYPVDVRFEKLSIVQFAYRNELLERRRLQLERKRNVHIVNMLEGEGFLEGCPELQEVRITSAFFCNAHLMNPSSKWLRVLELVCVDAMQQLPDLSSCAGTLQILTLLSCNDLKQVDFSALGLLSLLEVTIAFCSSLEKINLGGLRPCLQTLLVSHLFAMSVLSGLCDVDLVRLQFLEMGHLLNGGKIIEGCLLFVDSLQQERQSYWRLQHLRLVYFPVMLLTSFSVTSLLDLVTLHLEFLTQVTHIYGVESLIHLRDLSLKSCKSLEELPSLHALQRLERLVLGDCVKLRAVQGCDQMRVLEVADFQGCESLEEPPFQDLHFIQRLWLLIFEECKFACSSQWRELMVKWVREVELSRTVLLRALLRLLLWEYYSYHQANQPPLHIL